MNYRKLKQVATMQRGTSVTQNTIVAGNIPVISGGQTPAYYCDKANRSAGTITVAGSGAHAGFVQYWNEPIFVCDAFSVQGIDGVTNTKYLYYVLQGMQNKIFATKKGSGVPHVHISCIENFEIPIPPLAVQEEIVRILDKFTELEVELEAELEKEQEARKKQYEWYRDWLLDNCANAVDMEFGDLFDLKNGFAFKSNLLRNAGSPILRITNIQANSITVDSLVCIDTEDYKENLSEYAVNPGDIVIAMSGATTGKIGVNKTNQTFFLNQRVGKFIPKENVVLNRFLYHLLLRKYQEIYAISCGGAQPNLSSEKLKRIRARIPPLEEQQYIVTILDHLDALCNDITTGLPAEIAARRKQYEYYRDKLLSFEEAA